MNPDNEEKQRRLELASFLRSRRARTSPGSVGLPERTHKRTPGLRREDVAELANISLSWYAWLEQARNISVSNETLNAIAAALHLGEGERKHLFDLAKPRAVAQQRGPTRRPDMQELERIVQGFSPDYPVTATGRYMELLAWNEAASKLYDDFRGLPEGRLSWVWFVFRYQPQAFFADWETFARCTLALVRSDYGKYLGTDTRGERLIAELRAEVPIFGAWWSDFDVLSVPHPHKTFNHPDLGVLHYLSSALTLESQPEVRIVVHTPTEN